MNKKIYLLYLIIPIYTVALSWYLFEIIQAGISNIKLYQILLVLGLLVVYVDRIKSVIIKKNQSKSI
jgi:hypothetical protein